MQFINLCGYGNTGCTSQTDFLGDHRGVVGALPPFHEIGFLKCHYSFGGVVLAKLRGSEHVPTKDELRRSLAGIDPEGPVALTDSARLHLEMRERLAVSRGEAYTGIVDNALAALPDDYREMDVEILIPHMRMAVIRFVLGLARNVQAEHFAPGEFDAETSVLGFKNDPPGAYPIFSSFLPGGMTSAILRDPRDTTYDFNRHYGLGHSLETVRQHCAHYNAQLNSARWQIEKYESQIKPFYVVIDFERLIQSESFRNQYRDLMIGARERVRETFDPEKSAVNINHYTNMEPELVQFVEDHCMENYLSYRSFLKGREMLLD